jgi:coenzyme F420-reducing hydrogenase delta subunit/Pyruvate/2-oxoacid:ferredoxin oxidoreductase delta subunit
MKRALAWLDHLFDRLYGSRWNPLYQSGVLVVLLSVVLLVTGLYLLLFYRIGEPWGSVDRITDQAWGGRWIRSLHRFASDAAVVAIGVHALRMFLRGRTWGARALAWVSGLVLLGVFLVCGWTGFVMVWDVHGQVLAMEGGRLLDALPIFSEPIGRTFAGEQEMPPAFFFMNLFLHIALPIGIALILYVHVSRLARPRMMPPRGLTWGTVGALTALSLLWPVPMFPEADAGRLPGDVPLNWFYSFWVPVTRVMPVWAVWLLGMGVVLGLLLVPIWTRPRRERRPPPSVVDERSCVGCEQCAMDCPYEAIAMVARSDDRPTLVARVDPERCVSCGICAGSCAPMSVGPTGRTGRDQLQAVRAFIAEVKPAADEVVVVACAFGAGSLGGVPRLDGSPVYPVNCAGSLHTSVVEFLVRAGAGGVMVAACPARDCWNREGPVWTDQRLFHEREAELQERVDRRRVRMVEVGAAGRDELLGLVAAFREEIRGLGQGTPETDIEVDTECDVPVAGVAGEVAP